MITPHELLVLCEKHNACDGALTHLRSCKTLEEAADHPKAPSWAYWILVSVVDLPADARDMAERTASEDLDLAVEMFGDPHVSERGQRMAAERVCDGELPWKAYRLRGKPHLPEDLKRRAERKALEGGDVIAYHLRVDYKDLPPDVKRLAELAACKSRACATFLASYRMDLHPDTVEVLIGMGLTPITEKESE